MQRLAAIVLLISLAVLAANAAAAPEREAARIAITKVTIDEGGAATVRVAVAGFPASRGHWDLVYTLLDQKPGYRGVTHVRRGVVGSVFTNFQSGERWRLTALLVDHGHTKVFARASRAIHVK
jgi:glucose-6-phosphate dehydrogenase assembly protein OpcA